MCICSVEHLEDIGVHYYQTLRCWRENFLKKQRQESRNHVTTGLNLSLFLDFIVCPFLTVLWYMISAKSRVWDSTRSSSGRGNIISTIVQLASKLVLLETIRYAYNCYISFKSFHYAYQFSTHESWNYSCSCFLYLPDCVQPTWECGGVWRSLQRCTFGLLTASFIRTMSILQLLDSIIKLFVPNSYFLSPCYGHLICISM